MAENDKQKKISDGKRSFPILGAVVILISAAYLLFNHYRRVESNWVGVEVEKSTGTNSVHVRGALKGSFLSVQQINFSVKGEDIDIDLVPTYGPWAPSCDFDFVIYLHPETKRLRLGRDRAVIWTRGQEEPK